MVDVTTLLAIGLGAYLLYITEARLTNPEDPSFDMTSESDVGYLGILISGFHLVLAVVGLIAALTWPLPVDMPIVGLALVGIVVVHFVTEWREVDT